MPSQEQRAAKSLRVGERGIGDERGVAAPAVVVDHERGERTGVGRDLPVLPSGSPAGSVVTRLVDQDRAGDVADAAGAELRGEGRDGVDARARDRRIAAGDDHEVAGRVMRSSVFRRVSAPSTASAPMAVKSFWFDAGTSMRSASWASTSP